MVLIPCRPSLIDLEAIKRTAQLITATGKQAFVVLNGAPPTATALLDDARTLAEATGLQVARAVIRERSSFRAAWRSEEHTSDLQSLMRISIAFFCFQKK